MRSRENANLAHLPHGLCESLEEGGLIVGIESHEIFRPGIEIQVRVGGEYATACDNAPEVSVVEERGAVGIQCRFPVDAVLRSFQAIRVERLPVGDVGERVVACACESVLHEARAPGLAKGVRSWGQEDFTIRNLRKKICRFVRQWRIQRWLLSGRYESESEGQGICYLNRSEEVSIH